MTSMVAVLKLIRRAGLHLLSHLIAPVIFVVVLGAVLYIVALIGCLAGAEDILKFWGTDKTSCQALFSETWLVVLGLMVAVLVGIILSSRSSVDIRRGRRRDQSFD